MGWFDVDNDTELLRLLRTLQVNPEDAQRILAGGGFDMSLPQRPGFSPEEEEMLRRSNQQYGWSEISEIDPYAQPYSPEEKTRRAVLEAVRSLANRASSEDPKSAYAAAQLGSWLTGYEGMRGQQDISRLGVLGDVAAAAVKSRGAEVSEKQQLIAEALRKISSGSVEPEDLALLVSLGVPSWAVKRIAPEAARAGAPDPRKALLKLVNQVDITGRPSDVAIAAAKALAKLASDPNATDEDYWEALRAALSGVGTIAGSEGP